jgi:predicted metal-dependent enzyme (double-stranded beta helix superfamily)
MSAQPELLSTTKLDPSALVTSYAGDQALWRPLVRFDPAQRVHTRLDSGPGWEAWLLTWLPGQGTLIHDHGGSAGAFVVVDGSLTEETYGLRRLVTPSVRELGVGRVRAFSEHHVHRVTNTGRTPTMSVHVYAPGIASMTTYAVADGQLTAVGVERAGADW